MLWWRRVRFYQHRCSLSIGQPCSIAIVTVFVVLVFVTVIDQHMDGRHNATKRSTQPTSYTLLRTRNVSHFVRPDDPHTILLSPGKGHLCGGNKRLSLMVIVTSSPTNALARAAIRLTWASDLSKITSASSVFLVGKSSDHRVQAAINKEHLAHHDMVQVDLLDSYTNLTLKSTFLLRWLVEAAPACAAKAKFVLRVDDDVFVNAKRLWNALEHARLHSMPTRVIKAYYIRNGKNGKLMPDSESVDYLLLGHEFKAGVPFRDVTSKWYLPYEIYPHKAFPDYLAGGGYVFTTSVAHVMYTCALVTPMLPMEDVFITGLCANTQLGLKLTHSDEFVMWDSDDHECQYRTSMLVHPVDPDRMRTVWADLQQHNRSCQNSYYYAMIRTVKAVKSFLGL